MITIIVGGCFQGKRAYGEQICKGNTERIMDQVHEEIRLMMKDGKTQEEICSDLLLRMDRMEDPVLICDEVGCGIVPMDRFERAYREMVGRVMCRLVRHADLVYRVSAGIPSCILDRREV